MTICLGKNCSFGFPRVPFVNCCQFIYLVISFWVLRARFWDLIVSVPDHCLHFYFALYIISSDPYNRKTHTRKNTFIILRNDPLLLPLN